ncbi:VgrG protein [Grimontia indica]|uniref:VgrG protein n=2 Tax=Grimontia indica TaxID=1056512 RepID=R1IKB6_9GAMM|nr:VgrG protein [Grimontia indica]
MRSFSTQFAQGIESASKPGFLSSSLTRKRSPILSDSHNRLNTRSDLLSTPTKSLGDKVNTSTSTEETDGLIDQASGASTAPTTTSAPIAPITTPAAPGVASSGVRVTFPRHIRPSTSPTSMPDRIPPRVDTPIQVNVQGWQIPMNDVAISVVGAGGGNGSLTINGSAKAHITANQTLRLRGVNQTAVGNAGKLRLVADFSGNRIAQSAPFSVSAIPQNGSISFNSVATGARRGIIVNFSVESDSNTLSDLNEAEHSEQVKYGSGKGCLAGAGASANNSSYMAATTTGLTDRHRTPVSRMTSPGSIVAEQVFTFNDKRTGATDIPARNTGFRISRIVTEPSAGNFVITTSKVGVATKAKGFSSKAGSGSVSRTQNV